MGLFARSGDRGARRSAFARRRLHAAAVRRSTSTAIWRGFTPLSMSPFALGGRDGPPSVRPGKALMKRLTMRGDRLIGGPPVRRHS